MVSTAINWRTATRCGRSRPIGGRRLWDLGNPHRTEELLQNFAAGSLRHYGFLEAWRGVEPAQLLTQLATLHLPSHKISVTDLQAIASKVEPAQLATLEKLVASTVSTASTTEVPAFPGTAFPGAAIMNGINALPEAGKEQMTGLAVSVYGTIPPEVCLTVGWAGVCGWGGDCGADTSADALRRASVRFGCVRCGAVCRRSGPLSSRKQAWSRPC